MLIGIFALIPFTTMSSTTTLTFYTTCTITITKRVSPERRLLFVFPGRNWLPPPLFVILPGGPQIVPLIFLFDRGGSSCSDSSSSKRGLSLGGGGSGDLSQRCYGDALFQCSDCQFLGGKVRLGMPKRLLLAHPLFHSITTVNWLL